MHHALNIGAVLGIHLVVPTAGHCVLPRQNQRIYFLNDILKALGD